MTNYKEQVITLPPRVYYIYPDLQLTVCRGVSYTAKTNKWTFVAPPELNIDVKFGLTNREDFFTKLNATATEYNFNLPVDVNTTKPFKIKRIYVSKRLVSTKMVISDNGRVASHTVNFQFMVNDMVSFTGAINNAIKVRDLGRHINKIQQLSSLVDS